MIRDYSDKIMRKAEKMAFAILDEFGADMAADVKQSGRTPYDTGSLKDNCTHSLDGLAVSVMTQTGKKAGGNGYGYFVHEGTSRMPGRPFLRWASENTKAMWK